MSYSVLLVDDEELVYRVMIKKMNWDLLGFSIDGYARNGLEALDMAEEILPDVVMTDIKMPYMDGLTLAGKLKERYPKIRIIIFSGFDDFEFAKEAIRLEAFEYILKPIDSKELSEVFARVKENLDRDLNVQNNMDKLQEHYMNSLPLLQDNFCISLIEGRLTNDEIYSQAPDFQIELKGPKFLASIFRVEDKDSDQQVPSYLKILSAKKYIEEQLYGDYLFRAISYLGTVVVIIQCSDDSIVKRYTDRCDNICKMLSRILQIEATAGIGICVNTPFDIKESYCGARRALSHSVIYGNNRAINISEVESRSDMTHRQLEETLADTIIKYIRLADVQGLTKGIDEFCSSVCSEYISISDYRVRLMKFAVRLLEFIDSYGIDMDEIVDNDLDLLTNMYDRSSLESLKSYLMEICNKVMLQISSIRHDNTVSFAKKAKEYIKEHFCEQDLSVDKMCNVLNVSAAYFSTAFKKATGQSFVSYLTDIRMDKALQLLEVGDKKAYEIADIIGYSDPNYFSYVFKKRYGVSPSKYKEI